MQMKINTLFDFFKTLLLAVIFCGGLIYAYGHMVLTLQNYQYTADDFPPYFFERGLTKIIDTENSFQFKTYRLGLKFDMAEYKANIRPVLLKWGAAEYIPTTQSYDSSFLSRGMEENIKLDSYTGSFAKEIHIVTYQGRIEAVSYAENAEMQAPKIETIVANPEGLVTGQTTIVKGGGSALMDYMLRRFKSKGVKSVRIFSTNDKYYADRGWQEDENEDNDCTVM